LIEYHYGRDSFAEHSLAASSKGVVATIVSRPGLAFDVDSPDDLTAWRVLSAGATCPHLTPPA
jgi:2-phospho-L-lactate guanylyltransferase (CobY/MobA/RfbA family)